MTELIRNAPAGNIFPTPADIHTPEITAQHVKELARYCGAELVGIAQAGDQQRQQSGRLSVRRTLRRARRVRSARIAGHWRPGAGAKRPVYYLRVERVDQRTGLSRQCRACTWRLKRLPPRLALARSMPKADWSRRNSAPRCISPTRSAPTCRSPRTAKRHARLGHMPAHALFGIAIVSCHF